MGNDAGTLQDVGNGAGGRWNWLVAFSKRNGLAAAGRVLVGDASSDCGGGVFLDMPAWNGC